MYAQNCVDTVFLYGLIGHRTRVIFSFFFTQAIGVCKVTNNDCSEEV